MNLTERSKESGWHIDPFVVGTVCGIISAVVYTSANISLRAVSHLDPIWASWVKALPTTAMTLPWLLWRWKQGKKNFPQRKGVVLLIGAGFIGQVIGNVGFQYALGVIGLAVSVPILFGTMIVLGAGMGRLFLSEPISPRSALSIVVLLAAIFILSFGARDVNQASSISLQDSLQNNPWYIIGGIAAAGVCGMAYAILSVAIRHAAKGGTPLPSTLFIVSLCGVLPLFFISSQRSGFGFFQSTALHEWQFMLAAGICNAIAFLALTKALSITSVVHVNALNATQTAMAGIAGIFLFHEEANVALGAGIVFTILGLLLLRPHPSAAMKRGTRLASPPEKANA